MKQQRVEAAEEKETSLQAKKERRTHQDDALKEKAVQLERQEKDLKARVARLTKVRIPGAPLAQRTRQDLFLLALVRGCFISGRVRLLSVGFVQI